MKYKLLIGFFTLFLLASCSSSQHDAQEDTTKSDTLSTSIENSCFDRQMEAWFMAFHRYQEQGLTMYKADSAAMNDSKKELEACRKQLAYAATKQ